MRKPWRYFGTDVYPAGVNSSGIRWWAMLPGAGQLRADTMIATRPDAAILRRCRRNLQRCLDSATPDQWARGLTWYQTAHELARALAGDGNVSTAAGCIAALSAQKSWPRNLKLASDALAGTPNGHTADTLAKVRRILAGENPETVLPMDIKTGHFFRCIADPGNAAAVVVDRHVHDAIVGERYGQRNRGLHNRTRYAALAGVVRDVARTRGILASQAQPSPGNRLDRST